MALGLCNSKNEGSLRGRQSRLTAVLYSSSFQGIVRSAVVCKDCQVRCLTIVMLQAGNSRYVSFPRAKCKSRTISSWLSLPSLPYRRYVAWEVRIVELGRETAKPPAQLGGPCR